ncbi:hypothetical protein AMAG_20444 [Allomyces macrogynus ATCC 38327]|uniref:Uncharacterized protein n=1 Tax=Allomyces macrogynus (strain ATCC 38327) TaxID=578462 RepID=A0A0L0TAG9_ALLM3|nr:hypothetical protein AMAG_20444 [Allomyces macrogynus ATCC 38327]|eukprot:KNE71757.1 hypothetical protein AMAG_20444 [Allomyces macrogynus ATCC 38327]
MRSSLYFKAMLSGDWAETQSKDPISFSAWNAPMVALAFVHISSGWTSDMPLPAQTPADHSIDFTCVPSTLSFAQWRAFLDLAQSSGSRNWRTPRTAS